MPEGLSLGTQSSEGYNDTYKRCCFAHNSKSILGAEEGVEPSAPGYEPGKLPLLYSAIYFYFTFFDIESSKVAADHPAFLVNSLYVPTVVRLDFYNFCGAVGGSRTHTVYPNRRIFLLLLVMISQAI